MREAFLVNESKSVASIPLFEKVEVVVGNRTCKKCQFIMLNPGEERVVGTDISFEQKKFYRQLESIDIKLKFREIESEVPGGDEEGSEDKSGEIPEGGNEVPPEDAEDNSEEPSEDSKATPVEYTAEGLKKLRQAELIDIATSLGIAATTANSKADIAAMILEKVSK